MPRAESIFTMSAYAADETVAREKVLASLSELGTVDESTLRVDEIRREGEINYGTPDEPHNISLAKHNLVAFVFKAEVEPNEEQQAVLASRESA